MFRSSICLVVLACGASLLTGAAYGTVINYGFASDPGWLAVGNRPGDGAGQDFGYSDGTNYSGGTASEIGGVFNRYQHGVAAYYAADVGNLDLSQPIEMNWNSTNGANFFYGNQGNGTGDQGAMLGFFNRTTGQRSSWPVRPMLGVEIADYSLYSYAAFDAGNHETLVGALLADANYIGTLRMYYDPLAGSHGEFKVQLDSNTAVTYALTEAERNSGVTFDSFGMLTCPLSTNLPSSSMDFYVDSLAVTVGVPEPSSIAILSVALMGLLAYAWRKRR